MFRCPLRPQNWAGGRTDARMDERKCSVHAKTRRGRTDGRANWKEAGRQTNGNVVCTQKRGTDERKCSVHAKTRRGRTTGRTRCKEAGRQTNGNVVCTQKRGADARTDGRTDGRTQKRPKSGPGRDPKIHTSPRFRFFGGVTSAHLPCGIGFSLLSVSAGRRFAPAVERCRALRARRTLLAMGAAHRTRPASATI